mmetsp:Transcript_22291/g.34020  ORF Transcript_22291/g.34020 Transcript_22291/m.34020 type:complete len:106 (+) Transcript_22291:557-874(+)
MDIEAVAGVAWLLLSSHPPLTVRGRRMCLKSKTLSGNFEDDLGEESHGTEGFNSSLRTKSKPSNDFSVFVDGSLLFELADTGMSTTVDSCLCFDLVKASCDIFEL